ncbi:MAG TPA: putative motility protein [Pusillimonas sp.]|uniref:putative motility protein n=1 Tax=Pusillimonas sp. TaxID=3040095 RepID=UPI002C6980D8|nr:putative motility protein [Pusillimonas sp.]HUH87815.1 putative motility protein [Pusillimonas sp.]
MSMSVEATVGAAVALQNFNVHQEAQANLLRKTLDIKTQLVTDVLASMPSTTLATSGSLGTNINTYA